MTGFGYAFQFKFFLQSNFGVFFLSLLCFYIAIMGLAIFLSAFIERARTAGLIPLCFFFCFLFVLCAALRVPGLFCCLETNCPAALGWD